MNTLYIPIGISGSGKSFLGKKLCEIYKSMEERFSVVCPDDIRKRLYGDINHIGGSETFTVSKGEIVSSLKENSDVYFSSLNLNYRSKFINEIKKEINFKTIYIIMLDSFDEDLCRERVEKDLSEKKERSNTLSIVGKDKDVIKAQYENFCTQFAFNDGDLIYLGDFKTFGFEKNIMDTAVIPYSGNAEAVFITSELLKNDTSKIFIKKN